MRPVLLSLLFSATVHAAPLQVVGDIMAPFSIAGADGQPASGIMIDQLKEIMKRSGTDYQLRFLPWGRALNTARTEMGTCVYNTVRSAERESQFVWLGPIASNALVLLARADSKIQVNSLADVKGLRVGAHLESAAGKLAAEAGAMVDPSASESANARKLGIGRIDLWIVAREVGLLQAHQDKVAVKPVFEIKNSPLYLACHPSLAPATLQAWQAALAAMTKDGARRALLARYQATD